MPLSLTDMLIEVARGSLALLVAAIAIYLSLRLLGKVAKFFITLIVIALILYFAFSTDLLQSVKEALHLMPHLQDLFKGVYHAGQV